jgi:hypothetical protein
LDGNLTAILLGDVCLDIVYQIVHEFVVRIIREYDLQMIDTGQHRDRKRKQTTTFRAPFMAVTRPGSPPPAPSSRTV